MHEREAKEAEELLQSGLKDESASVRIAAADACLAAGKKDLGWPVMRGAMNSDDEWVRLLAANHLSLRPELCEGLPGLVDAWIAMKSDNRNVTTYVPRVANRSLNLLLGKDEVVR